jgi:hypothetical protein
VIVPAELTYVDYMALNVLAHIAGGARADAHCAEAVARNDASGERAVSQRTSYVIWSLISEQIVTDDLNRPRTHRLLRRPAKNRAGSDVELTPVTRAGDDGSREMALSEGTTEVRARVVERVQSPAGARHVHLRSRDLEHAHLAALDSVCATYPYEHTYYPPTKIRFG